MADFSRQDLPPKSGPKWWIERIAAGSGGMFTVFSRSIYGVWTHWGLYGSSPCLSERSKCDGCKARWPRRWKGYLHVYDFHNKRQCFLEITPAVAESISEQMGGRLEGVSLRGYRLQLRRGNGAKARLKVEVLAGLKDGPELPEEQSPEETLVKLWKMECESDTEC
jgi:hypothetical protein